MLDRHDAFATDDWMELREVFVSGNANRPPHDLRRSLLFVPTQSPRGGFISPRIVFANTVPQETPFSALLQHMLPANSPTASMDVTFVAPTEPEPSSLHYKHALDENTEIDEDEDVRWQESLLLSNPAAVPDEFVCPITMSVMRDPVVAQDGHTYEKSAIVRWLRVAERVTSPKTNLPMGSLLIENKAVKKMIAEWLAREKSAAGHGPQDIPGDGLAAD
jgi:hypothetical protein